MIKASLLFLSGALCLQAASFSVNTLCSAGGTRITTKDSCSASIADGSSSYATATVTNNIPSNPTATFGAFTLGVSSYATSHSGGSTSGSESSSLFTADIKTIAWPTKGYMEVDVPTLLYSGADGGNRGSFAFSIGSDFKLTCNPFGNTWGLGQCGASSPDGDVSSLMRTNSVLIPIALGKSLTYTLTTDLISNSDMFNNMNPVRSSIDLGVKFFLANKTTPVLLSDPEAPEPATWGMLAMGGVLLVLLGWRRRNSVS